MAVYSSPGLPAPTGLYGVGCIDIMPSQDEHPLIRLFYPSTKVAAADNETCRWFPHVNYIKPYVEFLRLTPVDEVADNIARHCNPAISALYDSPLVRTNTLPVVVFSHGRGGMRTRYSAICCDLASHGWAVAVPEHGDMSASVAMRCTMVSGTVMEKWLPYRQIAPGELEGEVRVEQVKHRTVELSKTLDLLHSLQEGSMDNLMSGSLAQFKGSLNLENVALIGHSLGGASAIHCLSKDVRYQCAIALDPLMAAVPDELYDATIPQPLLFINSSGPYQTTESIKSINRLLQSPGQDGMSQCNMVTLKGSIHRSQMDTLFVLPQHLFVERPSLNIYTGHHANLNVCHAFLKRYLLHDPEYQGYLELLDGNTEHVMQGYNK